VAAILEFVATISFEIEQVQSAKLSAYVNVNRSIQTTDDVAKHRISARFNKCVAKHFLFVHNDAHNYKITGILKQLKFRRSLRHVSVHAGTVIREPFLCLAKTTVWFYILVDYDVLNVMAAYQPVVRVCSTRWRRELQGSHTGVLLKHH
jgi:hypothetical protein